MKKLISILIPAYNVEKFIDKCLASIPQRDDIEVIVVDDCSTDGTLKKLKAYPNIRLLKNINNSGIGAVRQKLLDAANGEFIYFLDSDDYIYTDNFLCVIEQLQKTDVLTTKHKHNGGHTWTPKVFRGTFVRTSMAKNIAFRHVRCHEDTYWRLDFWKKYPDARIVNSNKVVYHYNFPRKGSLTDIDRHGGKK